MAIQPQVGTEPISGYRLVDRLGSGGFGEVWRATAPGGLSKAVKFVFGNLDDSRAEQELKSLRRIKEVRHPFLLSIERFEIIDGQLIIVTELADRSLKDRFIECRDQGLPGIPREELLVYMRDASDALDYMSEDYGLQHLDVKPENLLLVGKRVKVADFGLVKDLQGTNATVTGGVTPVYATPEAFDGRVSKQSDQYSLAIVYQELLTGRRPFTGRTTYQLAVQHLENPPSLSSLPKSDRQVIAKALSKSPEDRFKTCSEMINSLFHVGTRPAEEEVVDPHPSPKAAPKAVKSEEFDEVEVSSEQTFDTLTPGAESKPDSDPSDADHITVINPVDTPQLTGVVAPPAPDDALVKKSQPLPQTGIPPTLFIGLGGIGYAALSSLKLRMADRFGKPERTPAVQMLVLDADREVLRRARGEDGGRMFELDETLLLPLRRQEDYRSKAQEYLQWIDRRWLYGIPRSLVPEGRRSLGRLALVDNGDKFLDCLRKLIGRVANPDSISTTSRLTGSRVLEKAPRVFLVAGSGGGTGGGMLIDAAYAIRDIIEEASGARGQVIAVLAHGTPTKPAERDKTVANTYAMLMELDHFSQRGAIYPGAHSGSLKVKSRPDAPFDDTYMIHMGDNMGPMELDAAADNIAEYLYLNTLPSTSGFFSAHRSHTRSKKGGGGLRTFGISGFRYPKFAIADMAATSLCMRVVDRWRGRAVTVNQEQLELELLSFANSIGLNPKALGDRLHLIAQSELGGDSDDFFVSALEDTQLSQDPLPKDVDFEFELRQAFTRVHASLYRTNLFLDPTVPRPAERDAVESKLNKTALDFATKQCQAIHDWLRGLVERPDRTTAAAERATKWFIQYFLAGTEKANNDLSELAERKETMRKRLLNVSLTKSWFGKRQLNNEVRELFLEYCNIALEEVVVRMTSEALRLVYRDLSKFTEHFSMIRQRLLEFRESFASDRTSENGHRFLGELIELLPGGATNIEDAAEITLSRLQNADIERIDESFRKIVQESVGGVLTLEEAPYEEVNKLRSNLIKLARVKLIEFAQQEDAARLFFETQSRSMQSQFLLEVLHCAAPTLITENAHRHLLMALPEGLAGDKLQSMSEHATAKLPSSIVRSEGDVVYCVETSGIPTAKVAEMLINNSDEFRDVARKLVTRSDIDWRNWAVNATNM